VRGFPRRYRGQGRGCAFVLALRGEHPGLEVASRARRGPAPGARALVRVVLGRGGRDHPRVSGKRMTVFSPPCRAKLLALLWIALVLAGCGGEQPVLYTSLPR